MPNICVSGSGQHWFRQWLVTYSAPSHYLNQCWVIINWILRNKLQRNFNQSMKFSFTSMHLKMSPATWRPFCSGEDELSVAQRVFFQGIVMLRPSDAYITVTSSNGHIFRVMGPLWGESTCHRWIPIRKASDAELWCFLRSASKQTAE